jgi:hypothetical protein
MADDDGPKVSIPRNMRPRATPNAELNAQNRDDFLRQQSGEAAPTVANVPLRGYKRGGKVAGATHFASKCLSCKTY